MNQKWTIVSVFDGMACGALALQAAGIEIETYDAFEIEKYAIQTSQHNFPFIKHHGDVFKADFTQFKGVDLLMAGFPCTKFSIAQKNDRETQPYQGEGWDLFWQAYRAINEAKPRYFLLENNKSMAKAVREEISRLIGFDPVLINSALVSAQNRQRLYWVGKRNADGTYSKVNVEQPEDRGILLKDILEGGADLTSNDKAYCLTASYDGACAWNTIERSQRSMVAEPVSGSVGNMYEKQGQNGQLFSIDGKSKTLSAGTGVSGRGIGSNNAPKVCIPVAKPVGIGYRGRMEDGKWVKRFESNEQEKANALTTAQTDSMVSEPIPEYATPCEWDEEGRPTKAISAADGKTYTVYEVKDGKITIKGKQYDIKLADGYYIIRKLTVRECMRLQTVPEWFEFPVSDSRAYQQLGNGWTVDVIAHLLTSIKAVL
jgi:DNA (cytosine-5)-methyltransferase 3A